MPRRGGRVGRVDDATPASFTGDHTNAPHRPGMPTGAFYCGGHYASRIITTLTGRCDVTPSWLRLIKAKKRSLSVPSAWSF
jgi:hypothetical protein